MVGDDAKSGMSDDGPLPLEHSVPDLIRRLRHELQSLASVQCRQQEKLIAEFLGKAQGQAEAHQLRAQNGVSNGTEGNINNTDDADAAAVNLQFQPEGKKPAPLAIRANTYRLMHSSTATLVRSGDVSPPAHFTTPVAPYIPRDVHGLGPAHGHYEHMASPFPRSSRQISESSLVEVQGLPMAGLTTRSETHVELRLGDLGDDSLNQSHAMSTMLSKYATEGRLAAQWRCALMWLSGVCLFFENLQEPERTGWLPTVVYSKFFTNLTISCIGLNAIFIWITTDYEIQNLDASETTPEFQAMELAFLCFYMFELSLKLIVHRLYFFCNEDYQWNVFDFGLVLFSLFEQILNQLVKTGGSTANLSFLRVMRMLKMVKVLRLLRSLRFFSDLRLMMDCVLGSVVALFWCLVMIVFVLYIFAILIMQLLVMYMKDNESITPDADRAIMYWFGSVMSSCVSLFQCTTGGVDWGVVYEILKAGGPVLTCTFLFYILFFVVAAWNIVTSTFVEKAFKLAQPDVETLMLDQLHMNAFHAKELSELFMRADLDQSDGISYDEFRNLTQTPKFRNYLSVRGININDVDLFYRMLSSVSPGDEVDLNTLVNACLRMKGFATSIDLHALSFETKLMRKKMADSTSKLMSRLGGIEAALGLKSRRNDGPNSRHSASNIWEDNTTTVL